MEYQILAATRLEAAFLTKTILSWLLVDTASDRHQSSPSSFNTFSPNSTAYKPLAPSLTHTRRTAHAVQAGRSAGTRPIHQRHTERSFTSTVPISRQPAIQLTATEFSIQAGVQLRKVSNLGDLIRDYFFWHDGLVLVLERFSGHHRWHQLKRGWNNPHVVNHTPISLGSLAVENVWNGTSDLLNPVEKITEAARRALPAIRDQHEAGLNLTDQILARPEGLSRLLSLSRVSVMHPIVGIQLAIGDHYFIGPEIIDIVYNIKKFVNAATSASSASDLDRAAAHLTEAAVQGGDVFFTLLQKPYIRKNIRKPNSIGNEKNLAVRTRLEDPLPQKQPKKTTPPPPPTIPQPTICADIATAKNGATKKDRYAARMNVIQAAKQKPELAATVKQFELNNTAIERAKLADNIYNLHKKKEFIDPKQKELDKKIQEKELLTGSKDPRSEQDLNKLNKEIAELHKEIAKYPSEDTLTPPEGWKVKSVSKPGKEPVFAVYESTLEDPAKPVLVFRGTDMDVNGVQDWKTNFLQGNGMETEQYNKSIVQAQKMAEMYKDDFEIVGHSKAGGQAAAAGIVTGAKTYTFNAAGVHPRTITRAGGNYADADKIRPDGKPLIDAFNFPYDILNNTQDTAVPALKAMLLSVPLLWVKALGVALTLNESGIHAAGTRHTVPAQDALGNPIQDPGITGVLKRVEYHGMSYIINSMEKQKQDDLDKIANQFGCSAGTIPSASQPNRLLA